MPCDKKWHKLWVSLVPTKTFQPPWFKFGLGPLYVPTKRFQPSSVGTKDTSAPGLVTWARHVLLEIIGPCPLIALITFPERMLVWCNHGKTCPWLVPRRPQRCSLRVGTNKELQVPRYQGAHNVVVGSLLILMASRPQTPGPFVAWRFGH